MNDVERALREALDANALRLEPNRGGYPRHEPVPSRNEDIANLADGLAARLLAAGVRVGDAGLLDGYVPVRLHTGGVLADGTTNTPPIDFDE